MLNYRTKTYIAGDWEHDKDAIEILQTWNENSRYGLSFSDAHKFKQARDSSLNCSIKRSLADRLNISKTFVLIVGEYTAKLRAGSCQFCNSYNSWTGLCARRYYVDFRSYIEYECEKAVASNIKIIVLYNSLFVNKNKCPSLMRLKGIHIPMRKIVNGVVIGDYTSIKKAFDSIK